jgi:hypothetical protein
MSSAIPYSKELMQHLSLSEGSINNRMLRSSKVATKPKVKNKNKDKKNRLGTAPGEYLNRSLDKAKD